MRRAGLALAVSLAAAVLPGAVASGAAAPVAPGLGAAQGAAARFPQPVRVGDLPHRYLLAPTEAQHVLGRVAGVVRAADGTLELLVERGGLLGLGATTVAVPIADVALLGEHVALLGLNRRAFESLPQADLASLTPLPAEATIDVAIVGPFH